MIARKEPDKTTPKLSLRLAAEGDCKLLWQWRNEESTRRWSFNDGVIPYKEHEKWYYGKLKDAGCLFLIVSDETGRNIGQVRIDRAPDGATEINVSIVASARGRGIGSAALGLACRQAVERLKVTGITAHVKEANEASVRAFAGAGFKNCGKREFKGQKVVEMVWEPDK